MTRSQREALSAARHLITQMDADQRINLPPDVVAAMMRVREDCRRAESAA
jgi:hypothetical protein